MNCRPSNDGAGDDAVLGEIEESDGGVHSDSDARPLARDPVKVELLRHTHPDRAQHPFAGSSRVVVNIDP